MAEYMVWIWLIVFVLMLIIEFATADFLTVWFAISAVPTTILALVLPEMIWLQIVVFFLLGFILMLVLRKYVVKYLKKNVVSTNVDSYIGKTAIVIKTIEPRVNGLVNFENDTWTAVSNEIIAANSIVRVIAIEGNKLIVKRKEGDE